MQSTFLCQWNQIHKKGLSTNLYRRRGVLLHLPPPLLKALDLTPNILYPSLHWYAGVAELVDALDSKSSVGDNVRVRVSPPVPFASYAERRFRVLLRCSPPISFTSSMAYSKSWNRLLT